MIVARVIRRLGMAAALLLASSGHAQENSPTPAEAGRQAGSGQTGGTTAQASDRRVRTPPAPPADEAAPNEQDTTATAASAQGNARAGADNQSPADDAGFGIPFDEIENRQIGSGTNSDRENNTLLILEWIGPILIMLSSIIFGGALGFYLSKRLYLHLSTKMEADQETNNNRLLTLETRLNDFASRLEPKPAGHPRADMVRHGGGADHGSQAAAPEDWRTPIVSTSVVQPSVSRGGSAGHAGAGRITQDFAQLFVRGSPKLQEMRDFFARFHDTYSIRMTDSGAIDLGTYTGQDHGVLLAAVSHDGEFFVFPTYEYVSNFQSNFGAIVQNPPEIRYFFDLEADGTGALRLIAPASVEIQGHIVGVMSRGTLSGFAQ